MKNTASGSPTKEFFVGMLTRDIELSDAILDLLDNCLDGVVRQRVSANKSTDSKYYQGYFANITITSSKFIIEDNCGGIPRDIAEKYAFRMGRSTEATEDLPTVGIYGIGMKRAIFKIGKSAEVLTKNQNTLYKVSIPLTWIDSGESNWDFPITDIDLADDLSSNGTKISIENITTDIQTLWSDEKKIATYINDLNRAIQQSYSFIIQKGFRIAINGIPVNPLSITLLTTRDSNNNSDSNVIQPFIYSKQFDDISVQLMVGFYAPPPSDDMIDEEAEASKQRSSMDAGWTVVCNDRVVLYNDKTHLTGWGVSGVPRYHTQFIGIRGIVMFESNNPKSLPMTTTKRGVDTSSEIYSIVKDKMIEGTKMFTSYTNRWKGQNKLEKTYSTITQNTPIEKLIAKDKQKLEEALPIKVTNVSKNSYTFKPKLPQPPKDQEYKTIRYNKPVDDINALIKYFSKTQVMKFLLQMLVKSVLIPFLQKLIPRKESLTMSKQPFYHLRPNKHVDRSLFVQTLLGLGQMFHISEYSYTGFGSYTFDDFKILHDTIGISSMTSIENDPKTYSRAQYNQPYNCIKTIQTSSTDYLLELSLQDNEKNIFWLDYVNPKELNSQLSDYATLLKLLNHGDIVRITLNANPAALASDQEDSDIHVTRLNKLKDRLTPEYIPADIKPDAFTANRYPYLLLKILEIVTNRHLVDKPPYRPNYMLPLFASIYADGQQMLTFTGIVLNSHDMEDELKEALGKNYPHNNFSWDNPCKIDIPPLSLKEVSEINKLLPSENAKQQLIENFGFIFEKSEDSVDSYVNYYKLYPNYRQVSF